MSNGASDDPESQQEGTKILSSPGRQNADSTPGAEDEDEYVEVVYEYETPPESAKLAPTPSKQVVSNDKKKLVTKILLGSILFAGMLAVVVVLATRSSSATTAPVPSSPLDKTVDEPPTNTTASVPTVSPSATVAPSASPSNAPTSEFEDFPLVASIVSVEVLGDCAASDPYSCTEDENNALTWFNNEKNMPDSLPLKIQILAERLSLAILFQSAIGESWLTDTNHCTDWFLQVSCTSGHVDKLTLDGNDMIDNIHPSIGRFVHLETLHLQDNALTGLPTEIGQLVKLKELNVASNQLTGIPTEIGQLVNMEIFDIGRNALAGPLPFEIGLLNNLQSLDIGENPGLTGNIPEGICKIPTLNVLKADCAICTQLDCCTSTNCN